MITGQATYAMLIFNYIEADSARIVSECSIYLATSTTDMILKFYSKIIAARLL